MKKILGGLLIIIFLIFLGCENDILEYVGPAYQNAIYTMDSDGNNKEKILDTNCRNVQFIPNTNKILYVKKGNDADTLFIANDDGSENVIICDELDLSNSNPRISEDGQFCYTIVLSDEWFSTSDIYEFDLINNSYRNITNNRWKDVLTLAYKGNTLVYALEQSQSIWSLMKFNLNNDQLDTLLIAQANTYINPIIFGNTTNEIFFSWSGIDFLCGIYKMNIAENVVDTITTVTYGGGLTYTNNNLFIDSSYSDIIQIDLLTNNITSLVVGGFPDFHNDLMLFSTSSDVYNSEIRRFDLSSLENSLITSHGFKPKYSANGEKIVFIGSEQIY